MFVVPEKYRLKSGPFKSTVNDSNNGMFIVKSIKLKQPLTVISSDGEGWEHVSVSFKTRCPTWEEMSFIKSLFWGDDDAVIQIHPPKSEHINNHKYCLHLFRKCGTNNYFEAPPAILVGLKNLNL